MHKSTSDAILALNMEGLEDNVGDNIRTLGKEKCIKQTKSYYLQGKYG